jgi:general stress protein 26
MTEAESREKLAAFIKDGRTGVFTTVEADGSLVSRPMALQSVEFDGDLWFFTSASSAKVSEIQADPHVNVAFESGNTWVSVAGEAEILEDRSKAEELWNPFVKAYFPDGLEDPELRLVKVHATSAEYWDGDNKVVALFKMAKAAATDTVPDLGENKTLQL